MKLRGAAFFASQDMVRGMPKALWETEDQAQHNAVVGGRKSNTDKRKKKIRECLAQELCRYLINLILFSPRFPLQKPGVKAIMLVSASQVRSSVSNECLHFLVLCRSSQTARLTTRSNSHTTTSSNLSLSPS